ncbi:MAG TPA: acetate/propionate family kinase [Candidatus Limnocylindrales bacterium]|nr:acetate/propionate family kinase [Candidatus Limnocylindrales bacterium]
MAEAAGLILVVNAGSSSLKLRLLDPADGVVATADLPAVSGAEDAALIADAVSGWGAAARPTAVGHRVVHGGSRFSSATLLTDEVVAEIASLATLAPLHNPKAVAAIEAVRAVLPDVPHVACFDTAFHATLPPAASTYAIPAEWRERWAVRRYGFHGLNHAYVSRRAAELCGRSGDTGFRVVTCHLGAGSSLAAVLGGRSVDTTMGFTPLEGLVMATRSGDVDPGLLLWLAREGGLTPDELSEGLEHRSGLLGLGGTEDMREILERARATGDAPAPPGDARLARDAWAHRLRKGIASMAASSGGLDALVFTAGIGERSAEARALACEGLGFLGVGLDREANAAAPAFAATEIGAPGPRVRVFVIPAREDVEIARQVRAAG